MENNSKMENKKQLTKCSYCTNLITDEQVAKCKKIFKNLSFYRNKVFCEYHLFAVLDGIRERHEERRTGIKRLKAGFFGAYL